MRQRTTPTNHQNADGRQLVELYGPEDGGWYETRVRDWIGLCDQLRDADVRGYLVLRGLVIEKYSNPVRKLTLDEVCHLIPGPNGKRSSQTRVRDMLRALTGVGLVTTPEGTPLTTSSSKKAAAKPLRIRINDQAPRGYRGWRNAQAKLDAVRDAAGQGAHEPPEPVSVPGRNSDQKPGRGRNCDHAGRDSDLPGRNSDQDCAADLRQRDLPMGPYSGSSSPSGNAAGQPDTRMRRRERREPVVRSAGQSPACDGMGSGDGVLPEVTAFVTGLPGALGPKAAAGLAPLVVAAVEGGWTLSALRKHLMERCDTARVKTPATVYRLHLEDLPAAPAAKAASGGPTRAQVIAACTGCDEYGFTDSDAICKHPGVDRAALDA